MNFLIVTHVLHRFYQGRYYAYGPYVREMNIWLKHVDYVTIVAPLTKRGKPDPVEMPYDHSKVRFKQVPEFNITSPVQFARTMIVLPWVFGRILHAMKWADHIHLRCPGNMGLLGILAQSFFSGKTKTVKYAGNWDPRSYQPRSYRLQKKLLRSTKFCKNTKVLVYGEWPGQTSNILPFFTASYSESEREDSPPPSLDQKIKMLFVGSLSPGKQPLLAAKAVQGLHRRGVDVELNIYGEGSERHSLEEFIEKNKLEEIIRLKGNKTANEIQSAYRRSHFLLLFSRSEGWPKAVAEAMWWSCLPVVTPISCVPQMLDGGERGILVYPYLDNIIANIQGVMSNPESYRQKCIRATEWSRQFTLERFEREIHQLLKP